MQGGLEQWVDPRVTPFQKAHSTEIAGLHDNQENGDDRYYNNVFAQHMNLSCYDSTKLPMWMEGNVFLKGAVPSKQEKAPLLKPEFDPQPRLVEKPDGFYLEMAVDKAWAAEKSLKPVTAGRLGKAAIPGLPFENADGTPVLIDTDYFGKKRPAANPFPGPFEIAKDGKQSLKVWPVRTRKP